MDHVALFDIYLTKLQASIILSESPQRNARNECSRSWHVCNALSFSKHHATHTSPVLPCPVVYPGPKICVIMNEKDAFSSRSAYLISSILFWHSTTYLLRTPHNAHHTTNTTLPPSSRALNLDLPIHQTQHTYQPIS
jgi:hypothetical protein